MATLFKIGRFKIIAVFAPSIKFNEGLNQTNYYNITPFRIIFRKSHIRLELLQMLYLNFIVFPKHTL